ESSAMAVAREASGAARLGFWATGAAVFLCWNVATLLGALAGDALSDPRALGLDAAAPAAFVALLAPRLDSREPRVVALLAAPVALLAALIATQTFSRGSALTLDARAAGLVVAVISVRLRAPFLLVVASAAATTALLRVVA